MHKIALQRTGETLQLQLNWTLTNDNETQVLRGSNAIGLSVQTAVQVPGTAVVNMLQSLEQLLESFSSPRLDSSHITRLTGAVQG